MGLLDFLKISETNNPDLALKVFRTLSVGYSLTTFEQRQVDKILKNCSSRQDVLNRVIEICGEPKNPQQRYIYAIAYAWSNKEYREEAVTYLNLYLSNPLWDGAYKNIKHNINNLIEDEKIIHFQEMFGYLAQTLEKLYKFEDSLRVYEKMISLNPNNPLSYLGKVSCFVKMNKLDNAIIFLNEIKKSKYYKTNSNYTPNDWFIKQIDKAIADCKEKKLNGYVYKPKK